MRIVAIKARNIRLGDLVNLGGFFHRPRHVIRHASAIYVMMNDNNDRPSCKKYSNDKQIVVKRVV